jgi:hypothetical protein
MIIGLVGLIGSGKGTVADILSGNYNFRKESFAAGVKDAAAVIFGWNREMLEGETKESREWREKPDAWWSEKFGYSFTPRQALQWIGTEAGRDIFHPDLWILSLMKRVNPEENYVIADVRFPNEMVRIKELGGFIVWVSRGDSPEWFDVARKQNASVVMAEKYPEVHPSEYSWVQFMDLVDFTIKNDYTLDVLKDDVFEMYESFNYELDHKVRLS